MIKLHMYLETVVEGQRYFTSAVTTTLELDQTVEDRNTRLSEIYDELKLELNNALMNRPYLPNNKWPY